MELDYFGILQRARKKYAQMMEPVCRKWELTQNELAVLLFLFHNPKLNRGADISAYRGLAKSHVSLSVTNLESRGLLQRHYEPADRRTVHLHLTEAALPIVHAGQEAQEAFFQQIHGNLTPQEQSQYWKISMKISENIEKMG